MGVAVGEGQGPYPLGHRDGDELGDGTTTVIADEIDRVEPEDIEELDDHLHLEGDGQLAGRRTGAVAVGQEVDGQAPAYVGQTLELGPPQIGVQEDPVDEQGRRPLTDVEVGDVADAGRRRPAPGHAVVHTSSSRDTHGM